MVAFPWSEFVRFVFWFCIINYAPAELDMFLMFNLFLCLSEMWNFSLGGGNEMSITGTVIATVSVMVRSNI